MALGDIRHGLHSRIPWCCISFFVLAWNRDAGWDEDGFPKGWRWLYDRLLDATSPLVGYVRCPMCLITGREEKVHYCEKSASGLANCCD